MGRFWFLVVAGLGLLAAAVGVHASPVDGLSGAREKIAGGASYVKKAKFKGGERACVIAVGDHDPVVNLELRVENALGELIGEDKAGGDLCCVIWYPPRDGEYTISVAVPHIKGEADYNYLYVGLK